MKLRDALTARRRKKARLRYERERQRQARLEGQDAQEAVRGAARGIGPNVGTNY